MSSKRMIWSFTVMTMKNLFSRKVRSWLTMIGIFIGIAAVVSLISLGPGMQKAISDEFEALWTDTLLITTTGLLVFGIGSELRFLEGDLSVFFQDCKGW